MHLVRACTAIVVAIAVSAASTACGDNSPVSVPTSTLPAQQPSPTEAAPTVPEYTTDLDLNDEEKKAVDGALLAFEGYIGTMNRVFSSGGTDLKGADEYATGSSLEALNKSAKDLKDNQQYMAGEYNYYKVQIRSVESDPAGAEPNSVVILFCSNDSDRAVVDVGEPLPSQSPQSLTLKHTAKKKDGAWKIANQELWSKTCA
ncbi:hypothetical protein KACC15558_03270 [Brevibacterium ammoniilyticum]|uniref:Plastid division protein CDP1-like IMS domain-containing protein n=1 Tax=Brevibacterium ammoniilyticum TaxID=1046555 RepID=A0ABP9TVX4_9MICO